MLWRKGCLNPFRSPPPKMEKSWVRRAVSRAARGCGDSYHAFPTGCPALPRKNTRSAHQNPQIPLEKQQNSRAKKSAKLQSADEQLTLVDHLGGQVVVEGQEQLLVPHDILPPGRPVDLLQLVEGGAGEVQPLPVDVVEVR